MAIEGPDNSPSEWLPPKEALQRFRPDPILQGVYAPAEMRVARYGFRISNFGFVLATNEKAEIIEPQQVCAVPNTPLWFLGMINVRGNLVPVFDLRKFLAIEDETGSSRHLIIGQGAKAVALLVDELPESIEMNNKVKDIPPLPPIFNEFMRGIYAHRDFIWLDLDFDNFFSELGKRIIS